MAKDKEKSVNPAQQQRKQEKAKALKKAKAEKQSQRNEKLARRNPDRIQRQIDDLKALESSGDIKAYEKAQLEGLERDLRSVRKAREALGEKAPPTGSNRQPPRQDQGYQGLGKRQHNGERIAPHRRRQSDGSDTDESVRRIPMPEDTPPPIPREHRRYFNQGQHPNQIQLPSANGDQASVSTPAEAKTTYESAPQIRDLKKEATSRFVPDIVRRKQDAVRGQGGLVEPEEMDKLEAQGYYGPGSQRKKPEAAEGEGPVAEEAGADDDIVTKRLADEEARFAAEMAMETSTDDMRPPAAAATSRRTVQIEEVEDEDA